MFDRNVGENINTFFVEFSLDLTGSWLDKPPIKPNNDLLLQARGCRETTGVWDRGLLRPASDRFLTPKAQADKEQTAFLTAPNNKCVDQNIENFLSNKALVCNSGGKGKVLNLPREVFEIQTLEFPETPLWSTLDAHSRGSLKASATGAQINSEFTKNLDFILSNWDNNVDLQQEPSAVPLHQTLTGDTLKNLFIAYRNASQLMYVSSNSAMDWNKASIAACRHEGRQQVLEASLPGQEDLKRELLDSGYGYDLFGHISLTTMSLFTGVTVDKSKVILFPKGNTNKATGGVRVAKRKHSAIQSGNSGTKIVKQKPKVPFFNANTSGGRSGGQSSGRNEGASGSGGSSSSKNFNFKRGGGARGRKPRKRGKKR